MKPKFAYFSPHVAAHTLRKISEQTKLSKDKNNFTEYTEQKNYLAFTTVTNTLNGEPTRTNTNTGRQHTDHHEQDTPAELRYPVDINIGTVTSGLRRC